VNRTLIALFSIMSIGGRVKRVGQRARVPRTTSRTIDE
jgi:hypothetical protein